MSNGEVHNCTSNEYWDHPNKKIERFLEVLQIKCMYNLKIFWITISKSLTQTGESACLATIYREKILGNEKLKNPRWSWKKKQSASFNQIKLLFLKTCNVFKNTWYIHHEYSVQYPPKVAKRLNILYVSLSFFLICVVISLTK